MAAGFLVAMTLAFLAGARLGPSVLPGPRGPSPTGSPPVAAEGVHTGPGSIGVAEPPEIGPDCNTNVR